MHKYYLSLTTAALAFFAGLSVDALADAAGEIISQRGSAVERHSQQGVSASVKAWPSPIQTGSDGFCPQYGLNAIDAKTSVLPDGAFELSIPRNNSTFTVVYCAQGYNARVDRYIPSDGSSEFVIPTPADLDLTEYSDDRSNNLRNQILRQSIEALNDLSYIRSSNTELFDSVLLDFSQIVQSQNDNGDEKALFLLIEAVGAWQADAK
ncbi:MAG: hypothetical protein K9G71_09650 [Rhodobacteraceae bacterium]|nr:hypothetical protein [Paracoccaceae bacterium]MCF8514598.1 hypothetical protein [Paracoccaceae bacterium]MCF8518861.1 hypothetical protein [Paracoccaceae bacterium]